MNRGRIFSLFSHVRPFYEQAVSNLDRSMYISLWVKAAHISFIEGSHATKNMASDLYYLVQEDQLCWSFPFGKGSRLAPYSHSTADRSGIILTRS